MLPYNPVYQLPCFRTWNQYMFIHFNSKAIKFFRTYYVLNSCLLYTSQVREITLDMPPNMEQIARICFPAAQRVTDRFHVQKLAYEAVQEMRVKRCV